jgi:hypothetical protein
VLAYGLRRRLSRHARAVAAALAALTVLGLGVAAPSVARAAAEDDFVTVTPHALIKPSGSDGPNFDVQAQLLGSPVDITLSVNGFARLTYHLSGSGPGPYDMYVPAANFDCRNDNTVRVDTDYGSAFPAQTQTVGGLVVVCPQISVSPQQVAGTDPVTITLPLWDGFDTAGPTQGAKSLYIDTTLLGTFDYHVAPEATFTPACGDHTIKLSQPSPYGLVEATAPFYVYCPSSVGWTVSPRGLLAPQADNRFTLATTFRWSRVLGAAVYLDDSTDPVGTMAPAPSAPGTLEGSYEFSDNGQLRYGGGGAHTIHVKGTQYCNEFKTCPFDQRIPFYVVNPYVLLPHDELVQSALPFTETITLGSFENADDPYDRHPQPKTVYLDDEPIGTSTTDAWTGALNPPCGKSTLKVAQNTPFGLASVDKTLTVLCPQVNLGPAVLEQKSQPRTITLTGSSFHPPLHDEGGNPIMIPYTVSLDGTQVGNGFTNEDGTLMTAFTASGLACGPHDVTVAEHEPDVGNGGDGIILLAPRRGTAAAPEPPDPDGPITVSTVLVVNCPVTPVPPSGPVTPPGRPGLPNSHPPAPPPAPTLNVQPQVIIAGMTTLVTGTGFTSGRRVTLVWVLTGGAKQAACQQSPTAGRDGTFQLLCVVPQRDRIGQRTLAATDGARTARAGALVISGPMQPSGRSRNPRLVIRH